ncbi:squalene--hopene cyclase [Marinicrinis sediminis]|uniref:Squalene--hopene cyclase n=1 Tax=Marinicrinis sediminis TaxID=1652465 RepID=A0ABW5RE42_9BACL
MNTDHDVQRIQQLIQTFLDDQETDGSWRYGFEIGVHADAYTIMMLRSLQIRDEAWIQELAQRIRAKQTPHGTWNVYPDEQEGNLDATVEAYFALRYAGYVSADDSGLKKARAFIHEQGGLGRLNSLMTKVMLACCGSYHWPTSFPLPVEVMLLPPGSPAHLDDFSGYARVHLVPVMILADKRFKLVHSHTPDLTEWTRTPSVDSQRERSASAIWQALLSYTTPLRHWPKPLHQRALQKAEQYMLDRIEPDGTLYSYASATFLMIFALTSLGYPSRHPVIQRAIQGIRSLRYPTNGSVHVQNSTSTVWNTALISDVMQKSGVPSSHPAIRQAGHYLLQRQQTKLADWSAKVEHPVAGGWGFSDINTLNPDVDDTTAALRAISRLRPDNPSIRTAYARGVQWVLSMQNSDGGWPAFERNTNHPLLPLLPIPGSHYAATDPSTADLTGRTLAFLGDEGLAKLHRHEVQKAVRWLYRDQEKEGCWFGRWGISYIYGTWCAVRGLLAVGEAASHEPIRRSLDWLMHIQLPDGGWGESCRSDLQQQYVPLTKATMTQTAWAMDALIAACDKPTEEIERGKRYLVRHLDELHRETYPTGAGLPGTFYIRYHAYPPLWTLQALSHYKQKYGSD